ncbi:MAG: adenylate cyclase [Alphaproteobacteria bacterium]|nr:adenylate cyclase [Alphaproteobacteria bacterium]
MHIRILGGMEIKPSAGEPLRLPTRKTSLLLAALVLAGRKGERRQRLCDAFWPDVGEAQARSSLRQALAAIRRAISTEESGIRIDGDSEMVELVARPEQVDVRLFDHLLERGEPLHLAKAADCYQGDVLAGIALPEPLDQWLAPHQRAYRHKALLLVERLSLLANPDLNAVEVGCQALAERLLSIDPAAEEAHRALIRLHRHRGRMTAALRQFQLCTEALQRELGVQPEAETRDLIAGSRQSVPAAQAGRPAPAPSPAAAAAVPSQPRELPSIAVLPFRNLTSEPDQEYFADGVVDDIINGLSRYRALLFVIARNSTFTYKGRNVDVKQIGRELNVRYVLEGSVRRAGNRLRIGGQLIDATTALQIWSGRFEGEIADIFALQDRLAENVVGALVPQVREAEMNRARRAPTESIDAHLLYLQALGLFYTWSREGHDKALQLSYRAIELDRNYATPYGLALTCLYLRWTAGWAADPARELVDARRLCERVFEIGRDNFFALGAAGFALAGLLGEHERGAALLDESLVLNPNASAMLIQSSFVRTWLGEPELAIHQLQRAMRNSPVDALMFSMHTGMALAHFVAGRDDEAYDWAETALQRNPIVGPAIRVAAASAALLGRLADAAKYLSLLRQLDPDLRVSNLGNRIPLRRAQDRERLAHGLRKAGLPE